MAETQQPQARTASPLPNSTFDWGDLPLEIAHLILDTVDWPSHSACRQVCRGWREYLNRPRLAAKRYYVPKFVYRIIDRVREADGSERLQFIDHPDIQVRDGHQIHRLLGEPGLGFFLSADAETGEIKHRPGFYFAVEPKSHLMFGRPCRNKTDLRRYFPKHSDGVLCHVCVADMHLAHLKEQQKRQIAEDKKKKKAGQKKPKEEELDTPAPIVKPMGNEEGAWCIRFDELPFGDEIVLMTRPESIEVQVLLTRYNGKTDKLKLRLMDWFQATTEPNSEPLTINRMVLAVREMITEGISESLSNIKSDLFVRFAGMTNVPQGLRDGVLEVSLDIWVQDGCSWVACESSKYKKIS
ncbi:hypothetical protein TWF696_000427 [Orbilia brochopaga]|uniref:F-box domain-containing protein n=1 Tax=Orbilia brochopaga TaxID=3140254 RepID=A0AAV9VE06_9PEZI